MRKAGSHGYKREQTHEVAEHGLRAFDDAVEGHMERSGALLVFRRSSTPRGVSLAAADAAFDRVEPQRLGSTLPRDLSRGQRKLVCFAPVFGGPLTPVGIPTATIRTGRKHFTQNGILNAYR
jgi:hypothetical protein